MLQRRLKQPRKWPGFLSITGEAIRPSEASQIHKELQQYFTDVFLDIVGIDPGAPWPQRLRDRLKEADVVLVLISDRWLSAVDEYHRRRIDKPSVS